MVKHLQLFVCHEVKHAAAADRIKFRKDARGMRMWHANEHIRHIGLHLEGHDCIRDNRDA